MRIKAARCFSRSAVIFLLLCIIISASVYVWHNNVMNAAGPHQDDVLVVIAPGSGHNTLRHVLYRAGVLHQIYHYDAARILAGRSFSPKAGEFLLPAKTNLNGIFSIIHKGDSHQRRLTIVEGMRSADVLKLINAMPNLTGSVNPIPEEGSLRRPISSPTRHLGKLLINRMQESRELALAEAWKERAENLPYDKPYDALIMASIIEKEASVGEDRRLVAAVLINRLKKGMRLQSDPTVLYEASESPTKPPQITKTDLKTKTPWNTYVIMGCPKPRFVILGRNRLWLLCIQQKVITYILFLMAMAGLGLRKHWTHTTAM